MFLSLLKFDFFLFVGFWSVAQLAEPSTRDLTRFIHSIQLLVLVSGIPTAELAITIAALAIILVCLVLGAVSLVAKYKGPGS